MTDAEHLITPEQAGSLPGLFLERTRRTPSATAYRWYAGGSWQECSWEAMRLEAGRYRQAFQREGLQPGDRVAVMLKNGREWVLYEQAAMSLGLVVVPIYSEDRPDNAAYLLADSGARVLLLGDAGRWRDIESAVDRPDALAQVQRVVALSGGDAGPERIRPLAGWTGSSADEDFAVMPLDAADLASIVYTSGTTGRPKGVMLSHANILENAHAACLTMPLRAGDTFLSFLPLSHMLERTGGHYIPMLIGGTVIYNRAIPQLADDLRTQRPHALISVPRIYERMYAKIQETLATRSRLEQTVFRLAVLVGWRRFLYQQQRASWRPDLLLWPWLSKRVAQPMLGLFGGQLRFAISGGAALPAPVARLFLSLGAPIYQGYGMTEASPVVSVNRPHDNVPDSIGHPLPGVEVKLGEHDELMLRGPNVMQGYWNNQDASAKAIADDGWLRTGDRARVDGDGRLYIVGRLKEIIVLSNGEKVPPADMEAAMLEEPLVEQALVVGEGKPYLSALVVVNAARFEPWARGLGLEGGLDRLLEEPKAGKALLDLLSKRLKQFPGYAKLRRIALLGEPWTIENGLLTPTLKPRRPDILKKYEAIVQSFYQGHDV